MSTSLHSAQTVTDGNHVIQSLGPYADEAARLAATTNAQGAAFSAADVGRVAIQTDTLALWALVGLSPTRWQRIAGPMPVHVQAGAGTYNCVAADIDAETVMTSGSANAPTIANGLGRVGDTMLFRQGGAGLMTVTAGASVTINGSSTSAGQHSTICLIKRVTAATDIWDASGKTT